VDARSQDVPERAKPSLAALAGFAAAGAPGDRNARLRYAAWRAGLSGHASDPAAAESLARAAAQAGLPSREPGPGPDTEPEA
jgi:hypothetical protein